MLPEVQPHYPNPTSDQIAHSPFCPVSHCAVAGELLLIVPKRSPIQGHSKNTLSLQPRLLPRLYRRTLPQHEFLPQVTFEPSGQTVYFFGESLAACVIYITAFLECAPSSEQKGGTSSLAVKQITQTVKHLVLDSEDQTPHRRSLALLYGTRSAYPYFSIGFIQRTSGSCLRHCSLPSTFIK